MGTEGSERPAGPFRNSAPAEKRCFTGMNVERFRKVLDGEAGRGRMDLDLEDVISFLLRLKSLMEEKKVL